jgi:hypothetical protein
LATASLSIERGAWIKDLPVIGTLFDAAVTFVLGSKIIILRPVNWISALEIKNAPDLNKSLKYLVSGLVVSYCITVPALIKWDSDVAQGVYIAHNCVKMLLGFVIIHFIMKLFDSKATMKTTISLWSFSSGIFLPIMTIFYLPLMFAAGTWVLEMDFTTLRDPDKMAVFNRALDQPYVIFSQLALFVFCLLAMLLQIRWFKDVFSVSWPRTLGGITIGVLVAILIVNWIDRPVFLMLDKVLRFT